MLNKVHHVTFVVESISDMTEYMERNFSLSPLSTDEFEDRGFKSILYRIGETYVDFFEPLHDDTPMARQLAATGPGVMHVAWGVDGIDQVFALQHRHDIEPRPGIQLDHTFNQAAFAARAYVVGVGSTAQQKLHRINED